MGPRVRNGTNGYHLVVPLVRDNGSTVLVDRGFVSKERVDECKKYLEDGDVEILGMLRTSHVRNSFTPDNHPEKGEWYWADVDAMAEYAGGEKAGVQPVLVEEIFGERRPTQLEHQAHLLTSETEGHGGEISSRLSRGVPVGRAPVVDVRNSHASYVATWCVAATFIILH